MSSTPSNPFENTQDAEIIDKYISNDQQQAAVKPAPAPIEIPENAAFLCYTCKKSSDAISHEAQRHLMLKFRTKFLSYCSQRCFNQDLIPCTVQQTMDHQLLAQTIKQETKMWDLSVHVIIGLINKCIVEGHAEYGDDLSITGIYQASEPVYEWLNAFNIHHHCLFVEVEWKGGKKRFYMLQGKGEDPDKVQEVAEMLSDNVPKDSWSILNTIITNILDKPQIEKVRRLPMDAAKVQQFIVQVEPVLKAMKELGFTEQDIEGRKHLVWNLSGNQENLRQVQMKLKTLMAGGKIMKRTDRVPDPHEQFTSQQLGNLGVGSGAPERPAEVEKSSIAQPKTTPKEETTTNTDATPVDSAAALREKARLVRQQKEEDDKKREFERERRRRLDAKKAQEAIEEREEKQKELQRELEKEKKRREKQEDREAKRRLKEQLKRDKEERLARKHSGGDA